MAVPTAGYKGSVKIGAIEIGGSTTWSYSGSVRNMIPVDEFGQEIITHIPAQIEGGEVTITGNYKMDTDAGQVLLKTRFDSGDPITDLKLYINEAGGVYHTLDNTTSPASYVTVTNYDNIAHDKSGIGTFTATFKVSGKLLPVS